MFIAEVVEGLAAARGEVVEACHCLLSPSPDSLDRCSIVLAKATAQLAGLRDWLTPARGDPAALTEAQRLRNDVDRAGHLLRSAFEYHARWNQILGAMSGGYTTRGEPASTTRRGRVSVRG